MLKIGKYLVKTGTRVWYLVFFDSQCMRNQEVEVIGLYHMRIAARKHMQLVIHCGYSS